MRDRQFSFYLRERQAVAWLAFGSGVWWIPASAWMHWRQVTLSWSSKCVFIMTSV